MSVVPLNYIFKQIGVQFEPQGPGTQLSNMDPLRVKSSDFPVSHNAAMNTVIRADDRHYKTQGRQDSLRHRLSYRAPRFKTGARLTEARA